jgi:hypothetical protein
LDDTFSASTAGAPVRAMRASREARADVNARQKCAHEAIF